MRIPVVHPQEERLLRGLHEVESDPRRVVGATLELGDVPRPMRTFPAQLALDALEDVEAVPEAEGRRNRERAVHRAGAVSVLVQHRRQRRDVGPQSKSALRGEDAQPVLAVVEAGQDRSVGDRRDRSRADREIEARAFDRDGVEVRRRVPGATVGTEEIGSRRVERDEDHVHAVFAGAGGASEGQREEPEKETPSHGIGGVSAPSLPRSLDRSARQRPHQGSARPRRATAAPSPNRRRSTPDPCSAPGSRKCSSPGC